ncbi:MAG: DMT family transporter, partial [bacterium]
MADNSQGRAILILTAGAVCISFAAILVKWIGVDNLGPTGIGFWRTLFGGCFLFLFGLLRGKSLRISSKVIGYAAVAGFVFFLDLFFWHRSIIYSGAGLATILANTQVFGTAILSFFLFKEKLTLRFLLAAVSAMIGVVLLVGLATDQVEFTRQYTLGILFGLLTGVVYAHYIVILKKAGQNARLPDIVVFIAWTSMFSAFYLGVAALLEGVRFFPPDIHTLLVLLLL